MDKPKAKWKPPAGHKNGLGKARYEPKTKARKVAAMTDSDQREDDSTSEDDDTYVLGGRRVVQLRALIAYRPIKRGRCWPSAQVASSKPTGTIAAVRVFKNLYDSQEYDFSILHALSSWASKVHVKLPRFKTHDKPGKPIIPLGGPSPVDPVAAVLAAPPKKDGLAKHGYLVESKKKPADEAIVIGTPRDLSRAAIAALPQDRMRIELGPDELLCMVDSGTFVDAINAAVELPIHKRMPPTEHDKHIVAACGGKLTK